jgi:DNA-binding LytR/AlgR family response regulator
MSLMSDNKIFIKVGSTLIKRELKDIIYIEARENYSTLSTNIEKFTIHFTLNAIENHLPSETFIRVHPYYIVNKRMIHAIKENSLDLNVGDTLKSLPIDKLLRDSLSAEI